MHFNLPIVHSAYPAKRHVRRWKNLLYFYRSEIAQFLLLFSLLYLLVRHNLPERHSTHRLQVPQNHALATCLQTKPHHLTSFDPYVLAKKAIHPEQNRFESRFQEDVWDTLDGTALYPAWSDMRWNIPQYARGLFDDLVYVQAIAEKVVTGKAVAKGRWAHFHPYASSNSSIILNYVHRRMDRIRGLQYVANVSPRRNVNQSHTIFIQKSFESANCEVAISRKLSKRTVYVLLPYTGREERLRLFLHNFHQLARDFSENIVLIISVLRNSKQDIAYARGQALQIFGNDAEMAQKVWVHENDGDIAGFFSRGVGIREAAKVVPKDDDVILHCDVDMIVLPHVLERCRHNTILGSQVYYPVFYSLYPYANKVGTIVERNGFWRKTSFGMACMRKRDFFSIGAYSDAETRFHGWGSEDVYQFEKVRNDSDIVAFRAVEPGLRHRWHSKECNPKLKAYADCMKTNFVTMGHPLKVGPVLLESLKDVGEFFGKLQQS